MEQDVLFTKDSYEIFMDRFNISEDNLIDYGLSESIFIDKDKAFKFWEFLKKSIQFGNEYAYVRTYGNKNDPNTKQLLIDFYENLFPNIKLKIDSTNNAQPTNIIEKLTGLRRKKTGRRNYEIINYQVSHIFGKTKNVYGFTAPWNLVYMPKLMDPFTGHESHGDIKKRFTRELQLYCYEQYSEMIEEYNEIMKVNNIIIEDYLNSRDVKKFKPEMLKDFDLIRIKNN